MKKMMGQTGAHPSGTAGVGIFECTRTSHRSSPRRAKESREFGCRQVRTPRYIGGLFSGGTRCKPNSVASRVSRVQYSTKDQEQKNVQFFGTVTKRGPKAKPTEINGQTNHYMNHHSLGEAAESCRLQGQFRSDVSFARGQKAKEPSDGPHCRCLSPP